jgi:DNA-binding MarR family transcriptional regulator
MQVNDFLNSTESNLHQLVYYMDSYAAKILEKYFDVNFNQFRVLMIVTEKKGINQKFLSNCVGMTEAGISKSLFDLEQKGYLKSTINPANRRERKLDMTKKGSEFIKKVAHKLSEMSKGVFSILNQEEKDQFHNTLVKLVQQIKNSN